MLASAAPCCPSQRAVLSNGARIQPATAQLLSSVQPNHPARVYKTSKDVTFLSPLSARPNWCRLAAAWGSRRRQEEPALGLRSRHGPPLTRPDQHCSNTDLIRFPFNNFTHCLTPFSRCFSSFPHGTCSLSVSCHYLALDEIYHPFWAAFPNNSTRRQRLIEDTHSRPDGILTLCDALFQGTWTATRAQIARL